MKRNFWTKSIPGFSLLETSMVLVIAGVMLGAVFKGKNILDQAKIRSVAYDFSRIQTALSLYSNTYESDVLTPLEGVWKKLSDAELWTSDKAPTSKLGGIYVFATVKDQIYLRLGKGEQGDQAFLTAAQASALAKQLQESGITVLLLNSSAQAVELTTEPLPPKERYVIAILIQR